MNRRAFVTSLPVLGGLLHANLSSASAKRPRIPRSPWAETSILDLQRAMERGRLSAVELVREYEKLIQKIDRSGPTLNSVIELNPDSLHIARALDDERKKRGARGHLHGIPILLKDNIDTADRLMTTAGSLALVGSKPFRDAFLVERLRSAGAIILGKTNLSEWANFRSNRSTSGWSGRGGLTRNPYALDRNTSGSSSGSAAAVAANLCAGAIGTETDGSIISPSSYCGIVGIKPTVGLVSRSGVIPISATQDTAGPMCRSVTDAAVLLGALTGIDSRDESTASSRGKSQTDYTAFLDKEGLRGARIGIARQFFRARNDRAAKALEAALHLLKEAGAEVVDPVEIPSFGKIGDAEFQVMLYEFKDGLNRYLTTRGPDSPIKTLADLIAFNEAHADRELAYFGQETFIRANAKGPLTEQEYIDAKEKCRRLSREEGIDAVMDEHHLNAVVAPSGGPAHRTDLVYGDRDTGGSSSYAAVAGYPSITVPAGFTSGLPFGLSFFGRAWSEPILLRLAFSFEQASHSRRPPTFPASIAES